MSKKIKFISFFIIFNILINLCNVNVFSKELKQDVLKDFIEQDSNKNLESDLKEVEQRVAYDFTYPVEGGNIYFYSYTKAITDCDDTVTKVIIPETINGIKVTSIRSNAFSSCGSLTSIEIPNSITSIGEYAFSKCSSLTNIEIPNSVTIIESNIFNACSSLTSINVQEGNEYYSSINGVLFNKKKTTILKFPEKYSVIDYSTPDSVTGIGNYAFSGCNSLKSIQIPNSITYIGNYAFNNCSNLTSISLPDIVYIKDCSIGKYAFSGCSSLTSIKIPNGVISIGEYAFSGCNSLKSIEIPNSITSIKDYIFENCSSLTEVEIPNSVTFIGYNVFDGCSSLKSIEIPSSVTSIGGGAFSGCSNLTSIEIPSSVTSIGGEAFSGCNNLTSIEIPSSITSIENYIFENCSNLTSIKIPSSVTSIKSGAFVGCSSLKSIEIPNSVISIGDNAFNGCSSLIDINVQEGNKYYSSINGILFDKEKAVIIKFPNRNPIISYSIPSSVTSIGGKAFSGCNSLISIKIPSSITFIGDYAFSGCSNLTSIEIPNSVSYITIDIFNNCDKNKLTIYCQSGSYAEEYAIDNDIKYEIIDIKENVTYPVEGGNIYFELSTGTIIDCDDTVTKVTIPETINGVKVISIGDKAFHSCSNLISIEIPNSITSIGKYAFSGCSGLIGINVQEGNEYYSSIDGVLFNKQKTTILKFPANSSITDYSISNNVIYIEDSAFDSCSSLVSIEIPNSISYIGNGAFSDCSSLTSIEIPNTITSIRDATFSDCSSLTSVKIPDSVTSIRDYAFIGCSSLKSIEIPNSVTSIRYAVFADCRSLISINVQEGNEYYLSVNGILFNKQKTTILKFPAKFPVTNYSISNSVTSIGDTAFDSCSNLASIKIPKTVTSIGIFTFTNCSSLTNIEIPDSVISIGNNAFDGCDKDKLTIYCKSGSYAEKYAIDNDIKYIIEGDTPEDKPSIEISILNHTNLENDTSNVNAKVMNNSSDSIKGVLFTVIYDNTGKLKDLVKENIEVNGKQNIEVNSNINCSIFPNDNIKIFLWNNLDDMIPMCELQEIKVV